MIMAKKWDKALYLDYGKEVGQGTIPDPYFYYEPTRALASLT